MAIIDLHDLFTETLKDVYYAEKKILKALPKMAKKLGPDHKLAQAFATHRDETEGQVERLEQVFALLGIKPKGKKCDAIEGLTAEADEMMEEVACKDTLAAALLADAQAVEHYEIARYGTLVAWAQALGLDEAAELLATTLAEEKKTDQLLNKLATKELNEKAANAMNADDSDEEADEAPPVRRRRAA